MTNWQGYVFPLWLYEKLKAQGDDVTGAMYIPPWIYEKNDVSPEALTARLHDRWKGTSFIP